VENERAKAQENMVDVDLKSAKADSERAKARAMHSDADNKDLDFLKNQSGAPERKEAAQQLSKQQHEKSLKTLDLLSKTAQNRQQAPGNAGGASRQG
jgi:hypothetical protein